MGAGAADTAAEPVSYTHLDVYKRQALILPFSFNSPSNSMVWEMGV